MLVLSFRDLAAANAQGITAGVLVEFPGLSPAMDWRKPESLLERITAGQARWISDAAAPEKFRDRRVCFVVHGFAVNRDHGYVAAGAMAQELLGLGPALQPAQRATGADLVIPVLWPGDAKVPVVNYPFEMGQVRQTGERFASFLRGRAAGASSVSFVSHSLGARVVLEAVTRTVMGGAAPGPAFETVILGAPAADQDELDNPRYYAGVKAVRRIVVVSSPDDEVLGWAYPIGNVVEAILWHGEKPRTRALGRHGPKPLKPNSAAAGKLHWFAIDDPHDPCRHGDYLPTPWTGPARDGGWNRQRKTFAQFVRGALGGGSGPAPWPEQQLPT